MTSREAADKVEQTLLAVPGVDKVEVGTSEQATVEYDDSEVTIMDLIRTLRRVGFLAGME